MKIFIAKILILSQKSTTLVYFWYLPLNLTVGFFWFFFWYLKFELGCSRVMNELMNTSKFPYVDVLSPMQVTIYFHNPKNIH